MSAHRAISSLFVAAALYDGLIGAAFLLIGSAVFRWFGATPPNHLGYVQFPGALLIVFAIMFVAVAVDPKRNRDLIPYGILLKIAYCGVVAYHWTGGGLPGMWKPFFFADLVFLVLFAAAWRALCRPPMSAQ